MKHIEIDNLVTKQMKKPKGKNPILDGIVCEEKYNKSKYKILWILKEPNGEDDDWDMREFIGNKKYLTNYHLWRRTFLPIIYSNYGILNNFCQWNDMEDIDKDISMFEVLRQIALINIKKISGKSVSNYSVIWHEYNLYKDIILKQIECYKPDIIIGGGTLHIVAEDLGFDHEKMKPSGESATYLFHKNQLFISAYHPNQRKHKQQEYCDDIINAAKKVFQK